MSPVASLYATIQLSVGVRATTGARHQQGDPRGPRVLSVRILFRTDVTTSGYK